MTLIPRWCASTRPSYPLAPASLRLTAFFSCFHRWNSASFTSRRCISSLHSRSISARRSTASPSAFFFFFSFFSASRLRFSQSRKEVLLARWKFSRFSRSSAVSRTAGLAARARGGAGGGGAEDRSHSGSDAHPAAAAAPGEAALALAARDFFLVVEGFFLGAPFFFSSLLFFLSQLSTLTLFSAREILSCSAFSIMGRPRPWICSSTARCSATSPFLHTSRARLKSSSVESALRTFLYSLFFLYADSGFTPRRMPLDSCRRIAVASPLRTARCTAPAVSWMASTE
mmetsp:Transcript_65575/g.207420  ORF Transcript_65575/g.207420 Transcript_65575/m.207420 type:complete len:286 (+) Transcript_65575:157-1014(+)